MLKIKRNFDENLDSLYIQVTRSKMCFCESEHMQFTVNLYCTITYSYSNVGQRSRSYSLWTHFAENSVRSLWEVADIIVVNLEKIGQYTVSVIENSVRSLCEVTDIININLEKIGLYTVSVIENSVRSLWEVTDIIMVN